MRISDWSSDVCSSDLIRAVRKHGEHVPILVLTARDHMTDRVQALDLGADDFMGKPFDSAELLARIRALHRRNVGRVDSVIDHGELSLDSARLSVSWRGRQKIGRASCRERVCQYV